ncbi:hypothetical protein SLS58_008246 [Diplodia intermedia]|uniref:Heterokaryon incompatibility domain-containing protein n=1 Tax=Diplodia intermedia TaxID=856260 RepID=A0ABR3THZ5_9PEZI
MKSFPWSPGNTYGGHKAPLYSAISYTWGRFMLADEVLPGVEAIDIDAPWKLPRINPSHFTVEEFKVIIKGIMTYTQQIPFNSRRGKSYFNPHQAPLYKLTSLPVEFLWLDIACIDQTPGSREKDLEIGRQAAIFRNAGDVFVWLNKSAQEEMWKWHRRLFDGLEVLSTGQGLTVDPCSEEEYIAAADGICGALDKFSEEPWFTSLWTLQEAFLCQNAFLLGKDGRRWTAGLDAGADADPDRLHHWVAILDILHDYTDDTSSWPLMRRLEDKFDIRKRIQRLGVVGITRYLPTAVLTVSRYRQVGPNNQQDRVYGIMQIFNLKLGNSNPATPAGQRFSVEQLQDQLWTALLEKYPLMSQLFVHKRALKAGDASEMASDELPTISLGFMVEKHLAEIRIDSDTIKRYPWTRGLASWYLLNHCLISNQVETESFFHQDQMMSYQLLFDWWTAAFQDPGTSLLAILDIVSQSDDLEQLARVTMGGTFVDVLGHLELKTWPNRQYLPTPEPPPRVSEYHRNMLDLFELEFMYVASVPGIHHYELGERHDARQRAIASAYTQRVAASCFANARKLAAGDSSPSGQEIFGTSSRTGSLNRGPALDCCTWLPPLDDKRTCLPYYLWDVVERRTILTASITEIPSYTCVSHTWGRWKLESEPDAQLEGVPWEIPRNSKFDVENLPSLLSKIPTGTPYVWFDLLCIPQDGSIIGAQEIARQGEIFRAAQFAIAWLNDVPELDALSDILLWIALQFLSFDDGSEEQNFQASLSAQALENIAGKKTNLFANHAGYFSIQEDISINPWFTSLWTLQEICLRPDMWLCVNDWSPLCIDWMSALPLNGLLCICKRFTFPDKTALSQDVKQHEDPAQVWFSAEFHVQEENAAFSAFLELDRWRLSTGLDRLLKMSRVDIISLGDRRHCTGRRAEAIMSALGSTDWYIPGEENDVNLVLEKYPLAFLEELKRKIPGEFFGTLNRTNNAFDYNSSKKWPERQELNLELGSILPFGSGFGNYFQDARMFHGNGDLATHPSLSSWVIEHPEGHVRMKRGCILSSPEKALARPEELLGVGLMPQGVHAFEDLDGYKQLDDLHGWVRTRPYDAYLVVTQHCEYDHPGGRLVGVHGVLLREVNKGTMVKLGTFHMTMYGFDDSEDDNGITDWRLPDEEEVDWMVL